MFYLASLSGREIAPMAEREGGFRTEEGSEEELAVMARGSL